jgi:putative SOS response-associated peptidase YedK
MKDQRPFTFAALWDLWRSPEGGELYSFTIITTEANKLLRPIHDRMPLIPARQRSEKQLAGVHRPRRPRTATALAL